MELSSRKPSKRAIEPVDEWLQNEGFYRKHAPKDPTCLFRAVSEQVYQNQRGHIRVRKECVEFMRKNRQMFEEKISIPYDSYLDQMACFTEWGGMNELLAMSLLFKRNVVIFHGQKLTRETTIDHGLKDSLYLCFTPPKQYETVYTQEYTADAGFCQSLIYQTLYKDVFKMNNVDITVHKMLHERSSHLRHDKFFLKGNLDIRNQLTLELFDKIEENGDSEELQLLSKGITPFPYRVAKALDPNIYRNVDYDIWHEIRREVRNSGYTKFNSTELQAGAKCLVQGELKDNDKANNNFLITRDNWDNNSKSLVKPTKRLEPLFYTGHIQEMSKNEGPVVVFIEELGEKKTVPYEALKPFPQKKMKQNNWAITANKRNIIPQNPKWTKKPWNSAGRRTKDQIPNDNNDKSQMSNTKTSSKNDVTKPEWNPEITLENHSTTKLQADNYPSYNANPTIENVRTVLENTHVSPTETVDQPGTDKKNKSPSPNVVVQDSIQKKQTSPNYNHDVNQSNKQQNQRIEKNEIYYPSYPSSPYTPGPRYPGDSEIANYDMIKNLDVDSNGMPYSDPATVLHFFNLGVKWSQNMWANGTNGQSYDNGYYIAQVPHDVHMNSNIVNGSIPNGENGNQTSNGPNNNVRHNNRSPPMRHRDQDSSNNIRPSGQKPNYRGNDYRNSSTARDLHQSNIDMNRNRIDYKNANISDQQQQQQLLQNSNNKDMQRNNKSNGMAPRFKRNYEARNRNNDHHNNQQHQYRPPQQQQQDHDSRSIKKHTDQQHQQQQQQQQQPQQVMVNQMDMTPDVAAQMQQQQQQHQHQPQQMPPLQQTMLQPQTPPPINGSYPYALSYNQQMPSYVPLSIYPPDSESYAAGHYYPQPSFIQVPYMQQELPDGSAAMQPMYPALDNGYPAAAAQYSPAVYSPQYVYHPPIYSTNQPGPPGPATAATPATAGTTPTLPDGCYSPYPGQPYFFPYPPPQVPTATVPAATASPQTASAAH